MLLLVLWIGYTMATTPPPIPLEKPLEIVREEYDSVSSDGGEEEN
jgi:predicted DNA-binding transcriptional regulator